MTETLNSELIEMKEQLDKLKLYLILHPTQDGAFLKWFDENRHECSWSFAIDESKKFFKGSVAKSYITRIFKKTKIMPRLLEISAGEYVIIDQNERVQTAVKKQESEKIERDLKNKLENKKRIEDQIQELQHQLNKL